VTFAVLSIVLAGTVPLLLFGFFLRWMAREGSSSADR